MVQVLRRLENNGCLQRAILPLCLRNHQWCGCSGGVASRTEPALIASGALFSFPRINFVCWVPGISKGFGCDALVGTGGWSTFLPCEGKHRRILRGMKFIHEQCLVSTPCPGEAVGLCRGFSVPAEHAAQKTLLSSRV